MRLLKFNIQNNIAQIQHRIHGSFTEYDEGQAGRCVHSGEDALTQPVDTVNQQPVFLPMQVIVVMISI